MLTASRRMLIAAAGALLVSAATPVRAWSDVSETAATILGRTNTRGGLVVHIGCNDGELTACLGKGESYLVHGLVTEEATLDKARSQVRSAGLYGRVSIDLLRGDKLPYADNLVQLVVAYDLGKVPMAEVMRVLSPGGAAWIAGEITRKPRPANIDEWTHYLHGPGNNAVAKDSVVDQPRRIQWVADPRWARSHDHLASTSAMVSAGGRMFAIVDEGSIAAIALPPKWMLVARDAFSGVLLWKLPVGPWEGHLRDFRSGPTELPRRLVAVGDRVYVTLGYDKPVTALDAATGKTVTTYNGTDNALEIICHAGTLLAVVGDRPPDNTAGAAIPKKPDKVWHWWAIYPDTPPKKRIMAFEAASGKPLWQKADRDTISMMPTTLAAAGERVFFHSPACVIALDEKSGRELWRSARPVEVNRPTWSAPTLVACGDVVLSGDRAVKAPTTDRRGEPADAAGWVVSSVGGVAPVGELVAMSASTGEKLWSCPCRESYNSPPDVLVADGLVWTGDLVQAKGAGITEGRDLHTGKVVRTREADQTQFNAGMHHRCYRNKATDRFLILGRDGTVFIDIATGKGYQNAWVRGGCQYGVMPCNGLVYAPSHSCACNIEIKLDGFLALAPQTPGEEITQAIPDEARLDRGEAYGQDPPAPTKAQAASDWPTYRHDAARTGRAGCDAPAGLGQVWAATPTTGRLSSPVAAEGKIFVACIDSHSVVALDASTGRTLWTFTAGGRIDSPPTIHQGLVLFGCADGRIYCLRAGDGKRVWTYLAAPEDRRVVSYEQVESAWPVSGSVLVLDGVACAVAGRSTFLDGGMYLCGLDPHTGRQVLRSRIEKGALPDVLSSDGTDIFMRSTRLDKSGAIQTPTVKHLYSPAGFLDGSWWHRTYWLIGSRTGSRWGGWPGAGNQAPAGRMLVVDGQSVYGFGRMNQYHRNGSHVGLGQTRYRLYACSTKPQPADKTPAKAKAKGKAKPKPPAAAKPATLWSVPAALEARGMVLAGETLFVAGPPDFLGDANDVPKDYPYFIQASDEDLAKQDRALAGQTGGLLLAVSADDGRRLAETKLQSPPVFDGMIAANGRLYVCTMAGQVICLGRADPTE